MVRYSSFVILRFFVFIVRLRVSVVFFIWYFLTSLALYSLHHYDTSFANTSFICPGQPMRCRTCVRSQNRLPVQLGRVGVGSSGRVSSISTSMPLNSRSTVSCIYKSPVTSYSMEYFWWLVVMNFNALLAFRRFISNMSLSCMSLIDWFSMFTPLLVLGNKPTCPASIMCSA